MGNALVFGGNSGIGLAVATQLLDVCSHIYIVGKTNFDVGVIPERYRQIAEKKTTFIRMNLAEQDMSQLDELDIFDIDTLVFSAGFGRVALFEHLTDTEICNLIKCNELAAIRIIRKFFSLINSEKDFSCAIISSIAGHVSSPFFSVYGAAKRGLSAFIENVNVELEAGGVKNRILDVSPGSVDGTAFNGRENNVETNLELAHEIISRMKKHEVLFIPSYETVYKDVIDRYHKNPSRFGQESYIYKAQSGRINQRPQVVVGYLSGTFDLFHIGHLNLLRRAKQECDYLIVGVHRSGAWKGKETFIPFEDRKAIVASVRYVDEVIEAFSEDSDAYEELHFQKLFVGSDYKGSVRFQKYEEFFSQKQVEIVYFPYTQKTSSTQLRETLRCAMQGEGEEGKLDN